MTEQLVGTVVTGGTAGLIAGLVLVILLLIVGKLVPGYIYRRETDNGDYWRDAFMRLADVQRAFLPDGEAPRPPRRR